MSGERPLLSRKMVENLIKHLVDVGEGRVA